MKPDSQWRDRSGSIVAAYRIMTVRDAKVRGDTASEVLLRLAAVIDGLPGVAGAEKAIYFEPWLEAVRHVYGPGQAAAALALVQAPRGHNGQS